jgi:hypothetical protein
MSRLRRVQVPLLLLRRPLLPRPLPPLLLLPPGPLLPLRLLPFPLLPRPMNHPPRRSPSHGPPPHLHLHQHRPHRRNRSRQQHPRPSKLGRQRPARRRSALRRRLRQPPDAPAPASSSGRVGSYAPTRPPGRSISPDSRSETTSVGTPYRRDGTHTQVRCPHPAVFASQDYLKWAPHAQAPLSREISPCSTAKKVHKSRLNLGTDIRSNAISWGRHPHSGEVPTSRSVRLAGLPEVGTSPPGTVESGVKPLPDGPEGP